MNGTVVVTETNPGPPVDPGTPWTDPDWEDPEYPGDGPLPLPNETEAPTVFEEGDNDAPLLEVLKVTPDEERESVKVRWDVSESGFVTLRLKLKQEGRRDQDRRRRRRARTRPPSSCPNASRTARGATSSRSGPPTRSSSTRPCTPSTCGSATVSLRRVRRALALCVILLALGLAGCGEDADVAARPRRTARAAGA